MSSGECPYCGSRSSCIHLVLRVDRTFLEAEEGVLLDAFNERWEKVYDPGDATFDEISAFSGLLEQVQGVVDKSRTYTVEGGPGMSSACTGYFCSTEEQAYAAVKRFRDIIS